MMRKSYLYLWVLIAILSGTARAQHGSDPAAVTGESRGDRQINQAQVKTDGCTKWFDANFRDCCVQHDIDYRGWYQTRGWQERLRADNRLFSCVAGKGFFQKGMAPLMWTGARLFGSPWIAGHKRNIFYNASKKLIRGFRSGENDRKSNHSDQKHQP